MKFFQICKKFFSPIKENPKMYFQQIFEAVYLTSYAIFSIEISKIILKSIESNDIDKFRDSIYLFFWVSIFVSLLRFTMYKWWWTQIMFVWSKFYYEKYLRKFIKAEWNEVERIWTWRFISIIEKWVHDWLDMLADITMDWVKNSIFILYAIFSIFSISFIWGIISVLLIFFWWFVATIANLYMKEKRVLRRKADNEANHNLIIALMSKNELMQNNWLETLISKIRYNYDMARIYQYPLNIWFLVIDEFPKVMMLIIRVWLYVYLANLVYSNSSSLSELAIFITILTLTELSLNNFLQMFRVILRRISSVEILWSTFDNLTPIKWFETWENFRINSNEILLKNLDYAYTDKKIFSNFSLKIEGNKKTAFVWLSWSWKTTLIKLIAWYIRPQKWVIDIFWNDLSKTSLKSYYEKIWYLTQEPSVFDWTIRENLEASVKWKISEESMKEALKNAECDFIFDFEKWIDTEIWEKWIRLSWWQRQRLAIAKIFIKNPEIILLDEPTSALDSFSEEKITEAMHRLFKWRTVIIIAHRLQTVKEADDIIVLENWCVVERWTHKDLIKKKWVYNKMLELQSGF